MRRQLSLFFATAGYVGLIPGAPGTYGSVLATLGFWTAQRLGGRIVPELHVSVCCLLAALGMIAAASVSRDRGVDDPPVVVIDEVAGQLIAFFLVPATWVNLFLGTALFRVFDIAKPYPIRKAERLPNGVGIVADDILAGVYANVCLQLLTRLF